MTLKDGFAPAFLAEREVMGLTQQQIATRLEVTISTIRNWEHGRSGPRHAELLRVCLLFGWQLPWDGDSRKRATAG